MNILILYTKLTDYWFSCMAHDVRENGNNYLVYKKAASIEAPFVIKSEASIIIKDVDDLDTKTLFKEVLAFEPNLIFISGWTDKRYLNVAKCYKRKGIPIVTGMDNQWLGTLKQHVASYLRAFFIRPYFSHIWIPGVPQYYFAKKLGFNSSSILTGLYCANYDLFNKIKQTKLNRQFLFIGRLVEHKGLKIFFKAINDLIITNELNFKIKFIGNGPLKSKIPSHPNIEHIAFIPPSDLPKQLENAGFFILPSLYEAWGVVVQEAALAGLPIISTFETGAASEFVINNYNGGLYNSNEPEELKSMLIGFSNMSDEKYLEMSKRSKLLALKINPNYWSAKINSFKI